MSKKDRKRQEMKAAQAAGSTEPSAAQISALQQAAQGVADLTEAHGDPGPPAAGEPPLTLSLATQHANELLRQAKAHTEAAKKRREEVEHDRLDFTASKKLWEDSKLATAIEQKAKEERIASQQKALTKREVEVLQRESAVADREKGAEEGFRKQQRSVLDDLQPIVDRLRGERSQLEQDYVRRRDAISDDLLRYETDRRRLLQEELERAGSAAHTALSDEIAKLRAMAEEAHRSRMTVQEDEARKRTEELEAKESTLAARAATLRGQELDNEAERQNLIEEHAAFAKKVARRVDAEVGDLRHEAKELKSQLKSVSDQRDKLHRDTEARKELDREFAGRTPEQVLAEFRSLQDKCDAQARELNSRPDSSVAERLVVAETVCEHLREQAAEVNGELAKLKGELGLRRESAIELETVIRLKEANESKCRLLETALKELRAQVNDLTQKDDQRSPMKVLNDIDESAKQEPPRLHLAVKPGGPTLKDFVEDLRHRIAPALEGRTLFYTLRDVRAFVGGLAMSRLMLLHGISGTGKTSLPLAFANAVGGGSKCIEVQAGWRDRQDLLGYYNNFHKHYYATEFLQALYAAGAPANRNRLFLIVLDEMNLARPEQYFADLLSTLQQPPEKQLLTLLSDALPNPPALFREGRHLPLPPNVWFVGTANHDETTAEFADKTYDRAHVMEIPPRTSEALFRVEVRHPRDPVSFENLQNAFVEAEKKHRKAADAALDWLNKASFADDLKVRLRAGWGPRFEDQLKRYLPVIVEAGGSTTEAMDHLLATKILRKLKDRHDVRAAVLEKLRQQILEGWLEKLPMKPERSLAVLDEEIRKKKGEAAS